MTLVLSQPTTSVSAVYVTAPNPRTPKNVMTLRLPQPTTCARPAFPFNASARQRRNHFRVPRVQSLFVGGSRRHGVPSRHHRSR